ncbi:SMI1/KNR4 family protein [Paenibacillus silvisoli]|uniref:SMI1/KNR4 family protein n=1 Tax=Paenibacillus silvisoli TaxID=3110539 RepID=UPI002805B801|nr:SMI1/KNR4 family protein [Paenibacillus silvisoli]
MNQDRIKAIIENNDVYTLSGTGEETIRDIEAKLCVKLPNSYKWILRNYGYVGFEGFEIDGIGLNDEQISVQKTQDWKLYGLPNGYVVISESGTDWIYCLDTDQMVDGECPIVAWGQGQSNGEIEAKNLYYFIERQVEILR